MAERKKCGHITQSGQPCNRNALKGQKRCKLHGGIIIQKEPKSRRRAQDSRAGWLAEDIAKFKENGEELPTTEDILIAFWVAMRRCPQDSRYLGVFKSLASGALDCRRQIHVETGGGSEYNLTLNVKSAPGEPLASVLGLAPKEGDKKN